MNNPNGTKDVVTMEELMEELSKLEVPFFKNNRTEKEQIYIHLRDKYDEFIFMVDNFIVKNNIKDKDALAFRQMILNYSANLLEKTFEDREKMHEYYNRLIGGLNIKFLGEDKFNKPINAGKTALMLMVTGMIFGHSLTKDKTDIYRQITLYPKEEDKEGKD